MAVLLGRQKRFALREWHFAVLEREGDQIEDAQNGAGEFEPRLRKGSDGGQILGGNGTPRALAAAWD